MVQAPASPVFEEGELSGRYRIIREIGTGGMGSVYLAELADRDPSPKFALKVVRFPSGELARRLTEESRILSRLEHPNVARLLDAGVTSAGLPFLVMEYVNGRPIDKFCAENKLNPPERARLFRQVCAAVRYLHQNLVVHRDLKPANILVTDEGSVRVVDFGIAKLLDQQAAGATLGPLTPEYASPEQVRGEPASTLTDVFALGVVLYEILAGVKPFRGNPIEVLHKVCEEEPARPSTIERAVSSDLDSIVQKAMRKEPALRYASVEQLDEDIRRSLEGRPILARGNGARYRAGKFFARHKAMLGAAAMVLVALAGGVAATVREARLAQAERGRAEREAQVANEQRRRAENSEAEAVSRRAEAERRLQDLEKLARGAVRAYGATVEPGRQEAAALLAQNVRDSLAVLGREGMLDASDQRLSDAASAELRSRELAGSPHWQVPAGWLADAENPGEYRVGVDREFQYNGKPSLFLRSLVPSPETSLTVSQKFDARRYRGKRVQLSVALRTEKVEQSAVLYLHQTIDDDVWGDGAPLAGSVGWKPQSLVMDVGPGAESVAFGVVLSGPGTVWASNFDFREVSRSVPLTEQRVPRNLNFTGDK